MSVLSHFTFILRAKPTRETVADVDDIAWRIRGLLDALTQKLPDTAAKRRAIEALGAVAPLCNQAYEDAWRRESARQHPVGDAQRLSR